VSHPAQVLVIRLTADQPGSYSGRIRLTDARRTKTAASSSHLSFSGILPNGMKYESQLHMDFSGGTSREEVDSIAFTGCSAITIVVGAGTSYVMDSSRKYLGADSHEKLTNQVAAASKRPYSSLKDQHVANYRRLFDRVRLNLGTSPKALTDLPTDERKIAAAAGGDPAMEELLFQYGRYLLISCSRPGSLPANLQGLWNDSNTPPWSSDYHANINVQMNYWPAEVTALPECHTPLFDLVTSQLPDWRTATAASPEYKLPSGVPVRGWAIRTSHNITGGMGWNWDKTANAWYCQHFWEHFAFTGDKGYLNTVAYPALKETCEFWEDHLKALPDGRLVVPNGWSPEHGPVEDGCSYNQEIVWDLFDNYVKAADALGIDKPYRDKAAAMRDRLVTPKIGRWGQLQEWMEDRDDPTDHHRHTSHLFAVYPGRQIGPASTPDLAAAAKKSLVARGDTGDVREWSFAWRTALYARLGDGNAAYRQMIQLFSARNSCPNLFGLHPPMQIDGNFGITAGIAEMLLQSHNAEIQLLPALPTAWPSGETSGLRARGGFIVNQRWARGRLVDATVMSKLGGPCRIRYGSATLKLDTTRGSRVQVRPDPSRPGSLAIH
jgi:alpha-L-fucosidase 2